MIISAKIVEHETAYGDIVEDLDCPDLYKLKQKLLDIMKNDGITECKFQVIIEKD